jgi:hypothetical protein
MKKIAILQSNYIPWKGYFDIIRQSDIFVIYDEVQYTKNDWRNRNLIKTANGLEWLTIPVKQNNLNQKINETYISNINWHKKHWNSILCNYSKSPYFKTFGNEIKSVYDSIDSENLSEINLRFIRKINELLGIDTEIIDSESLNLTGDKNERLIDAIKKLNGTHYLSGPAAKSYLNTNEFESESIQVEWMDYSNYPEYPQLFSSFNHNVSVLDLIFNVGDKALDYLNKE